MERVCASIYGRLSGMGRPRSWTDAQLVAAVHGCRSIAEVLVCIGLKATGANYKNIQIHIERLGLSKEHFSGQGWRTGSTEAVVEQPLEKILVRDSTYKNSASLKRRLIKAGLLAYCCKICGLDEWQGAEIALQLDHVNGDNRDNRLINLRLLCPNCHSQTGTFCRRKT